jgi:8-hydroxy-5-deazaflavin:NADPH oxidoreductase
MKYGVLGTGAVGRAIAAKLISLGHEVMLGSRSASNEKAIDWANNNGTGAHSGTFEQAASFGEIIFIATLGTGVLSAMQLAKPENFTGKTVIDITNPLDFSKGKTPTLFVGLNDSMGEQVQRFLPNAQVVKTLNIVNCEVMVNPSLVPGDPDMFLCGNSHDAKEKVSGILKSFGWNSIIDIGGIESARVMEPFVLMWVKGWLHFQTPFFAMKFLK